MTVSTGSLASAFLQRRFFSQHAASFRRVSGAITYLFRPSLAAAGIRRSSQSTMGGTMKAVVIHEVGGPEQLKVEQRPIPRPEPGRVLIRVRAFGLNRSEMFTRQGLSPTVRFPRVLGIEAVGEVVEAPGGEFGEGDIVATAMGGLGREFDGGYAEYTCPPVASVQAVPGGAALGWATFGAMPEMLQTAHGSLFTALRLGRGERLLIRGGTSSVGLAAAALAKRHGAEVVATTRRAASKAQLLAAGASKVLIDGGKIADQIEAAFPGGVDKILELVGATTLEDSLQCCRRGGLVCMVGMLGGAWRLADFSPMEAIPTGVGLTSYSGHPPEFLATPLEEMTRLVASGELKIVVGKTFGIDDIVEAHRTMEANTAGGKIVVLT